DIVEDSNVPMLVNVEEIDLLKQRFRIVLNHKPKRNLFKLLSLILCILALAINILSYFIIIQPGSLPDEKDSFLTSEQLTLQEDSFIIKNSKGQYELYIDNLFQHIIDDINEDEYMDIPVYEEGSD